MLTSLLIAILTSFITVQFALWRFHSEKWWERKADLYARLIEALYDMQTYNAEWIDHYVTDDDDISEKERTQAKLRLIDLRKRQGDADGEIRKLLSIGTFIASEEVLCDLRELQDSNRTALRELDESEEHDTLTAATKHMNAARICLDKVRDHAKSDLGVTEGRARGLIKKLSRKNQV